MEYTSLDTVILVARFQSPEVGCYQHHCATSNGNKLEGGRVANL